MLLLSLAFFFCFLRLKCYHTRIRCNWMLERGSWKRDTVSFMSTLPPACWEIVWKPKCVCTKEWSTCDDGCPSIRFFESHCKPSSSLLNHMTSKHSEHILLWKRGKSNAVPLKFEQNKKKEKNISKIHSSL